MSAPLAWQDYEDAAIHLGCDIASVQAVCEVESGKFGFNPDGSVKTLFEGHYFYRYTKGVHSKTDPDLSYPSWVKTYYGKTWQAEQSRLARAIALDREAALKSASWGRFQIMGFNYETAGFDSVEDFVAAISVDERAQLLAFVTFVKKSSPVMLEALRTRNWAAFARAYNGVRYEENAYDKKLATAYVKYASVPKPVEAKSLPDPTTQQNTGIITLIAPIIRILKILVGLFIRKKE
jgi:hypothetical protein